MRFWMISCSAMLHCQILGKGKDLRRFANLYGLLLMLNG
ncbi:hypothetical protein APA_3946 [Pseudanabaena sp. lw0831]|nr:hypothetical protein APA_3946 [Pseudanabaena sp. lw0831]